MIEAGVPDFTSVSFTAVVAPAGTPAAIVAKLNAAINESLRSPEVAGTLLKLSVDARVASPEEFAAFLARERDKWTTVVKTAGVQMGDAERYGRGFFSCSSKRAGDSGVRPLRWRASVSRPLSSQSPVAARRANVSQRSVQSPRP
jgi:hypothetical protein